jgi:hypothetical protein
MTIKDALWVLDDVLMFAVTLLARAIIGVIDYLEVE